MTTVELLAAHFADPHGCCWVVPGAAGPVMCGLWCGHDGDHLDYLPGGYFLPPMLHPLDALRVIWSHWAWLRCPMCRQPAQDWSRTAPDWTIWHVAGEERPEKCSWWRFGPCGCEARELLP